MSISPPTLPTIRSSCRPRRKKIPTLLPYTPQPRERYASDAGKREA